MILGKFWSRYDLQNFRKRNFLGDDQGESSKGTVLVLKVVYKIFREVHWPAHGVALAALPPTKFSTAVVLLNFRCRGAVFS